jgi:hypothetical protein
MSWVIRHFSNKDHALYGGLYVFSGALVGSMVFRSPTSGAMSGAASYLADCIVIECEEKLGRLSHVSRLALAGITLFASLLALEASGVHTLSSPERVALFSCVEPICRLLCLDLVEKAFLRDHH